MQIGPLWCTVFVSEVYYSILLLKPQKLDFMKKDILVSDEKKLTPEVGQHIGYELGAKMVKDYTDTFNEYGSQFIGKNIVQEILNQPGCIGLKIFNALNEANQKTYVITGVDEKGSPILEYTIVNSFGEIKNNEGIVADRIERDGWIDWIL